MVSWVKSFLKMDFIHRFMFNGLKFAPWWLCWAKTWMMIGDPVKKANLRVNFNDEIIKVCAFVTNLSTLINIYCLNLLLSWQAFAIYQFPLQNHAHKLLHSEYCSIVCALPRPSALAAHYLLVSANQFQ